MVSKDTASQLAQASGETGFMREDGGPTTAIKTSKNSRAVKLARAVEVAELRMEPFRRKRERFIREYVGGHYGVLPYHGHEVRGASPDHATRDASPLNTIFSMVAILVPNLLGGDILTDVDIKPAAVRDSYGDAEENLKAMRGFATKMQLRLNQVAAEIDLAETMELAVIDAIFWFAIVKTGIAFDSVDGWDTPQGYLADPGEPFVEAISLEDYFLDGDTRRRTSAALEGHNFTIAKEYAYDSGMYKRSLLDRMQATHVNRQDTAANLSNPIRNPGDDPFIEYFKMREVWLPNTDEIVTIPGRVNETMGFLREGKSKNPERGPYDQLAFYPVPDNPQSASVVAATFDLHTLINVLARQIKRQAEREKQLALYQLAKEKDAESIRRAPDGHMVGVRDPDSVKELKFGGVDVQSYQPVNWFQQWQNRIAGNPDLLGGSEAQSGTLGQDQMLMQNASMRVNAMRGKVGKFMAQVLSKLAWFVWTDPTTSAELMVPVAELDEPVPTRWDAKSREGNFLDYNIDVQAYSLQADNPVEEYRRTLELINQIVVPLADVAAAQGSQVDVAALVKMAAEKINLTDTDQWYRPGPPVQVATRAPTQTGVGAGGPTPPGGRRVPTAPLAPQQAGAGEVAQATAAAT